MSEVRIRLAKFDRGVTLRRFASQGRWTLPFFAPDQWGTWRVTGHNSQIITIQGTTVTNRKQMIDS